MSFHKDDTFKKVSHIIAEKLSMPQAQISMESTFKDLGADSIDNFEMIMRFEETFGIEIKDEDAEKIKTVADAVEQIHPIRTK